MISMKGFIGPIGDDLPSVVIIVLALGLFFSGIVFCLNAYNTKISNMNVLNGAMDISRVLTADGILTDPIDPTKAEYVAKSYGLDLKTCYTDVAACATDCAGRYQFNYLVAVWDGVGTKLRTLAVCVE